MKLIDILHILDPNLAKTPYTDKNIMSTPSSSYSSFGTPAASRAASRSRSRSSHSSYRTFSTASKATSIPKTPSYSNILSQYPQADTASILSWDSNADRVFGRQSRDRAPKLTANSQSSGSTPTSFSKRSSLRGIESVANRSRSRSNLRFTRDNSATSARQIRRALADASMGSIASQMSTTPQYLKRGKRALMSSSNSSMSSFGIPTKFGKEASSSVSSIGSINSNPPMDTTPAPPIPRKPFNNFDLNNLKGLTKGELIALGLGSTAAVALPAAVLASLSRTSYPKKRLNVAPQRKDEEENYSKNAPIEGYILDKIKKDPAMAADLIYNKLPQYKTLLREKQAKEGKIKLPTLYE